jgi:hypothetical protein
MSRPTAPDDIRDAPDRPGHELVGRDQDETETEFPDCMRFG